MCGKFTCLSIVLLFLLTSCKKEDKVTPATTSVAPGSNVIDATWTLDKPHSNVLWETEFYDFSAAVLTGRFNSFNFSPKFVFNETDLSKCSINAFVILSSFDSGEPGRDDPGKCGRSYLGVTYTDTLKTIVDPASDTAWFRSTSVIKSGTGYIVNGNFSFNRYRTPSGFADGTPIIKPVSMFVKIYDITDFDTNGDGITDRYRGALSGTFSFKRSDHMDSLSKVQWVPVPSLADQAGNTVAANNKTYGVWSTNVADEMVIKMNMQFYKNH